MDVATQNYNPLQMSIQKLVTLKKHIWKSIGLM